MKTSCFKSKHLLESILHNGHKGGIFCIDPIVKRIAFSLAHSSLLEQVNDYVMILKYQGEINICKTLRYVKWPFVWSYGRPNVPRTSVFFPAPSLCAMNPCFSELTVTFVYKKKLRHKRSLGYSSFDIIVSKP